MDDNISRCQSCGMPLNIDTFGTNASGSMNFEYCKHCFQKGGFTDEDVTLPQMVQITSEHLAHEMDVSREEAYVFAAQLLPTLKRWRNTPTT